MATPDRGEVWLIDLGLAAKVRPGLVISEPATNQDRALCTIVPHTTATRGTPFEVSVAGRFLKPGAFDAQNLITVPEAKLIRRLGVLSTSELAAVEAAVRKRLGL